MTNCLPIKPIHLAFLLVLLYFLVFSWTVAGLILFIFALINLYRYYGSKKFFQTCGCLVVFGLYFVTLHFKQEQDYAAAPASLTQIELVPDTISINGDLLSFEGKSNGRTYQAFYQLKSQEEQSFFQKLDKTIILTVQATTEEATPQRNFKGFDYRSYLKRKGIYRIVKIDTITNMQQATRLSLTGYLHDWRRKAIVHIQQSFPSPMQHYMTGLLFGYLDKSFEEMGNLYSSLGIIHLFALSGMQVGFFLGIFRFLFLRMGWRKDYVDWLQIPFSICYAGLTGFSVSVIRSLIQASLTNLEIKRLDNLALTLMIMFFFLPHYLLTTGGVLSFSYAFILSLIDFDGLSEYRKKLAETTAITFGILPVLIFYFATFQPASIVLTAVFSLVFDVFMLPVLSVIFLLSPLVKISFVNGIFEGLERVVTWVERYFNHSLVFGQPDLTVFLAMLIALGFLYDVLRRKKLALQLCLLLALLFFISKSPPCNEVTVVDIGQGDSIFLRDVTGKTMLIDVGGKVSFSSQESWQERQSDSNAERTLIPYLKSRGVDKIDQLVLTHTDTDHIGDMEVVAKHFKIGEVLVSPGSLTVPDFVKRLQKMKVRVRSIKAGDKLSIMGDSLQVLYPSRTGDGGNNDSLVLYGKLLDKTFLFTGDLEEAGEKEITFNYPNLQVDVLKAGHHGSKGSSSSEFLSHISPKVALISAGQNNRYHHPHQETLERFENVDSRVYRTDQQGAIRFIGWQKWRIETVR